MMWSVLTGLVGTVLKWALGLFLKSPAPLSPEAQQAANAAAANVQLNVEARTNAQVAQAIQAERQSDARSAADPSGLRDPSPDSRD